MTDSADSPLPFGYGGDGDGPTFATPTQLLWRPDGLRIVPPGVDDPSHRLDEETAYPISNLILNVLDQHRNIDVVESLVSSGDTHEEHVLSAITRTSSPRKRGQPIDASIDTFLRGSPPESNPLSNAIAEEAPNHLPPEVGLERCTVDFSPLGVAPVPTFRLALGRNREAVTADFLKVNPMAWSVLSLAEAGHPHIIQTLVGDQPGGDGYIASVRIAVLSNENAIATDADFLRHMDDPSYFGLQDIWRDTGLLSNFDLPIEDFYKEAFGIPWAKKRKYMERSDSRIARRIYSGNEEYTELLGGRIGYPELYNKVLGYPKMPVAPYGLQFLTAFVPVYYDASPWADVEGRDAPVVETHTVHQSAPGTDQPISDRPQSMPVRPASSSATEGGDLHKKLTNFAVRYYREQGKDAWKVDQADLESVPDAAFIDDGIEHYLEIEVKNETKPANLLVNIARARYEDKPVTVLTATKSHAEDVRDWLLQPYREKTDHGVRLFNTKPAVTLADGSQPVLPKGVSESRWYLDVDGTLRLIADDEVLATGPATASVTSFDFETYRYVAGETHQIVDESGTVIVEYDTEAAFKRNWTRVWPPHVPVDLHLLADVEIKFKSGSRFVTLEDIPDWATTTESATKRTRKALTQFLKLYTREHEGAEIEYEYFREEFRRWFRHQAPVGPDGEIDVPSDVQIGMARPAYLETKRHRVDGEYTRFIRDCDLLYPIGLWSPDLPFVDE